MKQLEIKNTVTNSLLTAMLLTFSAATIADETSNETTAYVDSIHQWGAWELDIEPAAGGITPPATQPLNSRSARITLRTNSIAALSPPPSPASPAAPVTFDTPTTPIVPPVVPVTPPPPPVTPPIGGPTDGLF